MIENTSSDKKIDILLSAVEERYQSLRAIRERVQNTGVWALGIMIGIGGWLLQSDIVLSFSQKIIYILLIIIASAVLRFSYLRDLNIGFKKQQQAAAKLEKALGFFTPGFFDGSDKAIYEESWAKAGTDKGKGRFFKTTFILMYIGVTFLIFVIMLNNTRSNHNSSISANKGFKQGWDFRTDPWSCYIR